MDGPWRVNTHGAKLVPARNGSGFEELRLVEYRSLAIYGPFTSPYLRTMASKLAHWVSKQPESLLAAVYDSDGMLLEEPSSPEALGAFLRSAISYGESIASEMADRGLVAAPNSKYLLLPLVLSSEQLSDYEIQRAIESLVLLSEGTTLRPVLILEDPSLLPDHVRELLSWQAFMGREQIRFSRDSYPMELRPGMATRVPMAIAIDSLESEARVLNSLSYEPTAAARERKQAIAQERKDYERFLEGLTDGK